MAAPSHLLTCPNDVLFLIYELCDKSSLTKLSLTSTAMREQCIPHLYRTVDVSSHNAGRISYHEGDLRPEAWACEFDDIAPENHVSRQRSFLQTMVRHPEYAAHVRAFSWTFTWGESNEYELTEIDYQLWAIFSRFDRVEKLDLAAIPSPDKVWGCWEQYTVQIPPVLFPRVMDLRLMGRTPHKLVKTIFKSIDISLLRCLSLDYLQERGNLPDGSPMPKEVNTKTRGLAWRAKLCSSATDTRLIFPGPMWIPVLPLIDKLSSLQHLEIRIPPLEEGFCYDGDYPEYPQYISVTSQLLTSVQSTLRELIIDHARTPRGPSNPNIQLCGTGRVLRRLIQNDRLRRGATMLNSLFPSLDKWNWKQLRSVTFKGFLDDSTERYYESAIRDLEHMRDKLENYFLGRGVHFEWENDSPRPAHLYMGHDNVDQEAKEAIMDGFWKTLIEDYGVRAEDRERFDRW